MGIMLTTSLLAVNLTQVAFAGKDNNNGNNGCENGKGKACDKNPNTAFGNICDYNGDAIITEDEIDQMYGANGIRIITVTFVVVNAENADPGLDNGLIDTPIELANYAEWLVSMGFHC